jgi:hypothetical protein
MRQTRLEQLREMHRHHLEWAERYLAEKTKEVTHVRNFNRNKDSITIERAVDSDPQVNTMQLLHERATQQAIMYGIAVLVEAGLQRANGPMFYDDRA